jgi:hypothetical protein
MRGGQWKLDIGENRPMTESEAGTEIMMRLPEQSLELVRVFIKASKNFTLIFLFDQTA